MKKPVKDLLNRLERSKPEINLSRLLLVVLPMIVALIVSLVSINLAYNTAVAATEATVDYTRTDSVYDAVSDLTRADAVDVETHYVRAAVGNTVVTDFVVEAVYDAVADLTRISVDDGIESGLARATATDVVVSLDR